MKYDREYLEKLCDLVVVKEVLKTKKRFFSEDVNYKEQVQINKDNISQPIWDMCEKFLNNEVELIQESYFYMNSRKIIDVTNMEQYFINTDKVFPILESQTWMTTDENYLVAKCLIMGVDGVNIVFTEDGDVVDTDKQYMKNSLEDIKLKERQRFTEMYSK